MITRQSPTVPVVTEACAAAPLTLAAIWGRYLGAAHRSRLAGTPAYTAPGSQSLVTTDPAQDPAESLPVRGIQRKACRCGGTCS